MVRILLADDHRIIREGLRFLLNREPGCEVVAEAETGRQAVTVALESNPHVVIMDINMPDLNGIEATRRLTAARPDIRIVGLSVHQDSTFIGEMFKAGALAYLPKDCPFKDLLKAIQTVLEGQKYLSPEVSRSVVEKFLRRLPADEKSAFCLLSDREREVVQLLSEGWSVKDIADRLVLSPKTVESHRKNIMEKLNIGSIAGLTKYAVREGLTTLND